MNDEAREMPRCLVLRFRRVESAWNQSSQAHDTTTSSSCDEERGAGGGLLEVCGHQVIPRPCVLLKVFVFRRSLMLCL